MTSASQNFRSNERGSVAVLVVLSLMVLVTIVLGVIEIGRSYSVRYNVQVALDAAALAAAKEVIDRSRPVSSIEAALAAVAQKRFDANKNINPAAATLGRVTVKYTPAVGFTVPDKVEVSVAATINNSFLGAIGMRPASFTLKAGSEPPQGAPVEMALVLDVTTSMNDVPSGGGKTKIAALKDAAKALVGQVMAGGNPNVKVGIVPYSTFVNIGPQNPEVPNWMIPIDRDLGYCAKWEWEFPNGQCKPPVSYPCVQVIDGITYNTTCTSQDCSDKGRSICTQTAVNRMRGTTNCIGPRSVYEPSNPANLGSNRTTEAYLDNIRDPTVVKYPNSYNTCNPAKVLPLTADPAAVNKAIDGLTAFGDTHIPNGLIWGWNMLTPEEPLNQASIDAALESIGGRKVIVLMTDGANSTSPRLYDAVYFPNGAGNNGGPWQDGTKAVELIKKICDNLKTTKIDVYTVLFDVQGSDKFATDTRTFLRDCPKKPESMSFSASDSAGLLKAFEDIGNQLRLLKITH